MKLAWLLYKEDDAESMAYTTVYPYNLSGTLLEETYPSGRKVRNTLNTNGDLSLVETQPSGGTYATRANNFTYTAVGAVSSMQLGNGRWESTQFNSRLQPTQIALGTTQNGTDQLKLNYDYGTTANNGNVVSQTITVPGMTYPLIQTYGYDTLNRLKSAEEKSNGVTTWKQTFLYDRYGNRNFDTANTTTLGSCSQQQCNPTISATNNRFTSGQGYGYDSAGNTTLDSEGRQFTYDAENKQTQVKDVNNSIVGTYSYDGDGKRIKKVATTETTVFVNDALGRSVEEYSGSTLQTAYVYAGSRLLSTENQTGTNYLTSDNLGTPRINTDSAGAVTARHDYMPFGEEIFTVGGRTSGLGYTADNVRKKFTGYERDNESDLDFAQARMYSSQLGRFISSDPLLSSGVIYAPQTWNRYSYSLNNPLKFRDPLGLYVYADGTSDEDKKRINKAYNKLVEALKHFKEGSRKYNEINKSIQALGKPGEANGVVIYVNNSQATPGKTDGAPQLGSDGNLNGKADIYIGLNLTNKSNDSSEGLAGTLGHEGRHASDDQSEAAVLTGLSLEAYNKKKDSGQIMSHAITEVNAYRVSSYIAEAISPSNVSKISVNGSEIWNRSWKSTDEDANRDKGIVGVLESQSGSYKFKFSPDPKAVNNSIDNPKLWTNNGGPIF